MIVAVVGATPGRDAGVGTALQVLPVQRFAQTSGQRNGLTGSLRMRPNSQPLASEAKASASKTTAKLSPTNPAAKAPCRFEGAGSANNSMCQPKCSSGRVWTR